MADKLLIAAKDVSREFVRGFESTSNKDKYYKLVDALYHTLNILPTADETFDDYMSKPRILTQGQRQIDLRAKTPAFKNAFITWLNTYPNNEFNIAEKEAEPDDARTPILPGVSRKHILQMIKHKNRLTKEQLKQLKETVTTLPDIDDPLITRFKSTFKE